MKTNLYRFGNERNKNWPGGRKKAPAPRFIVGGGPIVDTKIPDTPITTTPDELGGNSSNELSTAPDKGNSLNMA